MTRADSLVESLRRVEERIVLACSRVDRSPDEVTLIAVSKTYPPEDIQALYDAGQRDFGENYVQEWKAKADALPSDVRWHFIGALQAKKSKYLVNDVTLIHSVDRPSLMKELQKRSKSAAVPVLIQVNTGNDHAKGGVEPSACVAAVEEALSFGLTPIGLMTIPPFNETQEVTRTRFAELRECFELTKAQLKPEAGAAFVHLSMGMTSDFEIAIEEGATLVRVGTAIFGSRS